MKLLSATIRAYRIHREVTVEFDPYRTLIGGPNEVGKSTLIEAIHRGLFLKAKGTSALHKSLASTLHAGNPEVEISFEDGGHEYQLRKRFSGQNGTATLSQIGGSIWQGDEAEEKLASLLGCADLSGRATAGKVNDQWSHLWVWQGKSGNDPTEQAASQQMELLQRLQDTGGSVAMQSELDAQVANRFTKAREQTFVRTGNAKANSDLHRAQTEFSEAEARQKAASDRLNNLQQAIIAYESAEETLRHTALDLEELKRQKQLVGEKIAQAEKLQQTEKEQKAAVDTAREHQTSLEKTEASIAEYREKIAGLRSSLDPKERKVAQTQANIADLRRRLEEADRTLQEAQLATRNARLRRDLAVACVSVYEKRAGVADIRKRLDRVRALQEEIEAYRIELSTFPEIDRHGLDQIQSIENNLGQATAALNAMSAEIKVVSADQPVRVGDNPLEVSQTRTIVESTDVTIGGSVCLRIHPGGGESLREARQTVGSLNEQLQRNLDRYGIESTKRAAEIVAAREDLDKKIKGAQLALDELAPEKAEEIHAIAKDALNSAQAEQDRRLALVKDFVAPPDLDAAMGLRDTEDRFVKDTEANERTRKVERDALLEQVTELDGHLSALSEGIKQDQYTLTVAEAQLDLLLTTHGDDAARNQANQAARTALTDAENALEETRNQLNKLQVNLLNDDRDRLDRAIESTNQQREQAKDKKGFNLMQLHSDGSEDPQASLAQAEARLNETRQHLTSVSRKAEAIALLDNLFQKQQQELADRFSQPLADKITGYLQCLFGPDVEAVVSFEDNAFKAIKLVRSSQAMAFDVLSGGTREQVAAAVRLAIAELLATEHDGVLPVVFDDAFAYADPDRVQMLQRMLDFGAKQGLQIIVLTCNPSDYAALGARQVMLAADKT